MWVSCPVLGVFGSFQRACRSIFVVYVTFLGIFCFCALWGFGPYVSGAFLGKMRWWGGGIVRECGRKNVGIVGDFCVND